MVRKWVPHEIGKYPRQKVLQYRLFGHTATVAFQQQLDRSSQVQVNLVLLHQTNEGGERESRVTETVGNEGGAQNNGGLHSSQLLLSTAAAGQQIFHNFGKNFADKRVWLEELGLEVKFGRFKANQLG